MKIISVILATLLMASSAMAATKYKSLYLDLDDTNMCTKNVEEVQTNYDCKTPLKDVSFSISRAEWDYIQISVDGKSFSLSNEISLMGSHAGFANPNNVMEWVAKQEDQGQPWDPAALIIRLGGVSGDGSGQAYEGLAVYGISASGMCFKGWAKAANSKNQNEVAFEMAKYGACESALNAIPEEPGQQ